MAWVKDHSQELRDRLTEVTLKKLAIEQEAKTEIRKRDQRIKDLESLFSEAGYLQGTRGAWLKGFEAGQRGDFELAGRIVGCEPTEGEI